MNSAVTSGGTTNYVYNALGQLIEKSGNGGTTLLMYDEWGHIIGEYSSTGALIEETIWMGNLPVATLQPNGSGVSIYYIHTDHLGTPRKITNPSGNTVVWRWDPDTFGSLGPSITTIPYNLRFPGQYFMAETGLNQNLNRDYDPIVARYIESDPIGLMSGGYSTYAYATGSPINRTDSRGLAPEEDEFPPEADPAESGPIVTIQYESLLQQIREYDPTYEDITLHAPNSSPTRSDVRRLQQELYELKYSSSCPAPRASREFRRKPGSLGMFKGADALNAENKTVSDAAQAAGLNQDQASELHDEVSGQNFSYWEILQIAISIKNGTN
jgi:RHS repeat-associated protein